MFKAVARSLGEAPGGFRCCMKAGVLGWCFWWVYYHLSGRQYVSMPGTLAVDT